MKTERKVTMKHIEILILITLIAALFVAAGLSGNKILFIDGPRPAVIALGIVGMALCAISVGKAITAAPASILAILGYLFGAVALLAFLTQIFKWEIPFIGEPKNALIVLGSSMVIKSFLSRFVHLLGSR
jgi:drug/metabolite transporter (DMT)-like permease